MSAQSNADSLLAAVRQFHEKAAEDEQTKADLAERNAHLRLLLDAERRRFFRCRRRLLLARRAHRDCNA